MTPITDDELERCAMDTPPADDLEKRLRALQSYLRSAAHGTDAFDADVAALDAAIALRHKLEEAERWAALRAQDIITLGQQVGRAQAQRDALAKVHKRLLNAADYYAHGYLQDERDERNLCLSDDHWAAIQLLCNAIDDAKADAAARAQAGEEKP